MKHPDLKSHARKAAAVLLSGSALCLAPSAQAGAAAPDTGAPSEDITKLTNFVVSAEKRAGTVQDTPMSISVDTGETLQARGITDFTQLAAATPGVTLKNDSNGETEIEMRGMASAGGNSPTVGFYIDEIPITPAANAQNGKMVLMPPLFDTARVEVLRGPQGTLYGSGSMGGTVKIIGNQPDLSERHATFQSTLSGTEGGGFNHSNNLMVNLPILQDKLAFRFVATEAHTSGWIPRIVSNNFPLVAADGSARGNVLAAPVSARYNGSNADQYNSTRGGLTWKVSDRLTLSLTGLYLHEAQDGPSAYDSSPGTMAHYEPFDVKEPKSEQAKIGSINASYTGEKVDISWVNAYWSHRAVQLQSASEEFNGPSAGVGYDLTVNGFNPGYYGPKGTGIMTGLEYNVANQYSSELRVSSNGKGPLTWVTGAYFDHFWSVWHFTGLTPNYQNYADQGPVAGPDGNPLRGNGPLWFGTYAPTKIDQYAVFGNVDYAITSKLKASVGLRFNRYEYHFLSRVSGWGSAYGGAQSTITGPITQSENVALPKFNLNYIANSDLTIYGTVAEGYRPGGGNNAYPSSFGNWLNAAQIWNYPGLKWPSTYKSDTVWSYELGTKTRLLNRRLQVNASVYYENWKNIQLGAEPNAWILNINGNKADIYGGDIEVRGILGHGFSAGLAAGYTYIKLDGGPYWLINPRNVMPDTAPFNGNVDLTHSTTVFQKYLLTTRLETSYVDRRYSFDMIYGGNYGGGTNTNPITGHYAHLPGYALTNFRTGIEAPGGRWGVTFFVNNVFNKHAQLENIFIQTLYSSAFNRIVTNQPLTSGVDLTYRF
jgi:outer membrane receptor protein involved in Fe transport